MEISSKKIVVMGDVTIDHLDHYTPAVDVGLNWQMYPSLHTTHLPGGAFLMAEMFRKVFADNNMDAKIISQKVPENLYGIEAQQFLVSKAFLSIKEKESSYKIRRFEGYVSPKGKKPPVPGLTEDTADAGLFIIDDAGNESRTNPDLYTALVENPDILLLYKMNRPLAEGALWNQVVNRKGEWALVITANDLRVCSNVQVSKGVSWERTAKEMVFQLKRNQSLHELSLAPYIIILFGMDGALIYPQNQHELPLLIFDPLQMEGNFLEKQDCLGQGLGSAFMAGMGFEVYQHGLGGLIEAVKRGLSAMRNILVSGFTAVNNELQYNYKDVFSKANCNFSVCSIPGSQNLNEADPDYWRILDEKTKLSKPLITANILKKRHSEVNYDFPVGKFGKLQTLDRCEIEQFNSIKRLIAEFLADPKVKHPLCIGVFGPPGSGKSFGIKQLLSDLGSKNIKDITFNISQYSSYNDLVSAFHKIRDIVLKGDLPVAFFDEFDSDKDNNALGWLKYFLAPMQDGEFKEGEAVHPLGKCIFIFAGGTRSSFEEFEQNTNITTQSDTAVSEKEQEKYLQKRLELFRAAKGPDFVSRLRGFIDILGPNPKHQKDRLDNTYIIRRAQILRSSFEETPKTKHLINSSGELKIDEAVLRALLNIPFYKHGNRSMSAILEMSRLTDKKIYELSALPAAAQLNMHVDERVFLWLTAGERFYSLLPVEERLELAIDNPVAWEQDLIDKIAEMMHNEYCHQRIMQGQPSESLAEWSKLSADKQESNLDLAADIPTKLSKIGFGIRLIRANEPLHTPDITDSEIDLLAQYEHERWCREQTIQGWTYGPQYSKAKHTHPDLISWHLLAQTEQNKDREVIYAIPRILKALGFCIYRFQFFEDINENLISNIARAIHADYCHKRMTEGQSRQSNLNLVDFDELSEEIKEANMDSARSIPRKLKLLGIDLLKMANNVNYKLLALSDGEVEVLSQWEHCRWNWQKIIQGWVYGAKKHEANKTHPCILPWNELPENIKEYDRENVRLIPEIIQTAGYQAIRKYVCTPES